MYEIIATFEGSGAYYGSHATTYINVEEAPPAQPETTPPPESIADIYFIPAVIGIIIAIIVVGAVIVLMQRKR
jgi:NADH:ubiquinone oxidoreductase subunit F (NADH-binding)